MDEYFNQIMVHDFLSFALRRFRCSNLPEVIKRIVGKKWSLSSRKR
jgi:hypothetical protein